MHTCIISAFIILGVAIGHLRFDVHVMAVIWLGQAIWFILVGSQLCARPARRLSTQ